MIYEPQHRPLSAALAAMPDLRNRLLAAHVPDASGRRCRACTTPGTGTPGATLALPDSRGRRGGTGHNRTGNAAFAHDSSS